MKKMIVILFVLVLVLVACSGSVEEIVPTATVVASVTSRPTVTEPPIPTPTETPVPTATLPPPTPTPVVNELPMQAYMTLLAVGEQFNNPEAYLAEREIYTVMLEYDLDDSQRAEVLSKRGIVSDSIGDLEAAIEDYAAAAELESTNPAIQYSLCWDYALTNQPETGLPFCEEAVKITPRPYFIDGRAITYAMLGRFDDALQDLEIVIADLEENYPDSRLLQFRVDWASALERGEDPFSQDVLDTLKNDYTMMVDEAPVYVPPDMDYSRETFQRKLEGYDFAFGEVETEDGEEVLIGRQQDGACQQGVKLVGAQEEISTVKLSVFGCSDAFTQGNITQFMGIFYFNDHESETWGAPVFGRVIAWIVTDVYYVIEGMQLDPVSVEIENIRFTAVVNPEKQYAVDMTAEILP